MDKYNWNGNRNRMVEVAGKKTVNHSKKNGLMRGLIGISSLHFN